VQARRRVEDTLDSARAQGVPVAEARRRAEQAIAEARQAADDAIAEVELRGSDAQADRIREQSRRQIQERRRHLEQSGEGARTRF
jgi:hypothetical protein